MKKKLLAFVLVLTLVTSVFSIAVTTSAVSGGVRGDADGDGKVTTNDALIVLRVAAGIEDNLSNETKVLCDVNEDGVISLFDARKILRGAAGLINLEPTGAFKGFSGGNLFNSEEELVEYFNTNINKIKSERYGFTTLKDVEMQKFEYTSAKVLGTVETENTDNIIQAIFDTVGSDSDTEEYVIYGTSSLNKMSVEGKNYVSALTAADVLGSKAVYDETRGTVKITIAIPDSEKCDIIDSSYIKVFNSNNLLGATETTLNSILSGVAAGTEVVHYKNAVLIAEFEVATGNVVSYETTYETEVYIEKAQSGIITLEGVTYKTKNTVDYIDFCYD